MLILLHFSVVVAVAVDVVAVYVVAVYVVVALVAVVWAESADRCVCWGSCNAQVPLSVAQSRTQLQATGQ